MGCDIHVSCEKKDNFGTYQFVKNVDISRNYALFGWLANVRNYSSVKPLFISNHILVDDCSETVKELYSYADVHSVGYLTIDELLKVNYDEIIEDRRVTIGNDGSCTCEEGKGKKMKLRDFIGEDFIYLINSLKKDGVDRIVFWFDN